MTGDRKLTDAEKRLFIQHDFNFIEKVVDSGGEPSLYDTFFIELLARLESQFMFIVDLGKKVKILEDKIRKMEEAEGSREKYVMLKEDDEEEAKGVGE